MERKNLLGHIYGSRVSENGKWYNLLIAVKLEDGSEAMITCPIRTADNAKAGKPFGRGNSNGNLAVIDVPFYEDRKPKEETPSSGDLPF